MMLKSIFLPFQSSDQIESAGNEKWTHCPNVPYVRSMLCRVRGAKAVRLEDRIWDCFSGCYHKVDWKTRSCSVPPTVIVGYILLTISCSLYFCRSLLLSVRVVYFIGYHLVTNAFRLIKDSPNTVFRMHCWPCSLIQCTLLSAGSII